MREHNKYMKSIVIHNPVMNLKEYTDYGSKELTKVKTKT